MLHPFLSHVASSQLPADCYRQGRSPSTITPVDSSFVAYKVRTRGVPSRSSLSSTSCMDLRRQSQYDASYRETNSRSSSRNFSTTQAPRTQAYSSPLPQTQWTEVPASYRPREWESSSTRSRRNLVPAPLMPSQPQQAIAARSIQPAHAPSISAPRRRRRPLPLDQDPVARPANPSLLYPQMSPYATQSAYFAPDDLQNFPRSVSQPNTPRFFDNDPQGATNMTLPRAPTYPPSTSRRHHSASRISDTAFDDEQEFSLFVEATAGLGPIPTLGHSHSSSSSSGERLVPGSHSPESLVSPIAETPRTMYALQHLAGMPQSTPPPPQHRTSTSMSAWPPPPQPPPALEDCRRQMGNAPPPPPPIADWRDVLDVSPVDEELPDYASSQAQAQASQRVEATRRADELQRRWRESGRRMGRFD